MLYLKSKVWLYKICLNTETIITMHLSLSKLIKLLELLRVFHRQHTKPHTDTSAQSKTEWIKTEWKKNMLKKLLKQQYISSSPSFFSKIKKEGTEPKGCGKCWLRVPSLLSPRALANPILSLRFHKACYRISNKSFSNNKKATHSSGGLLSTDVLKSKLNHNLK